MAKQNENTLISQLPRYATKFGLKFDQQPKCISATAMDLKKILPQLQKEGIDLVVLVLYDIFSYSRIKRMSDIELGLRTQCVKAQTLNKPNVYCKCRGFIY